MFFYKTVVNCR